QIRVEKNLENPVGLISLENFFLVCSRGERLVLFGPFFFWSNPAWQFGYGCHFTYGLGLHLTPLKYLSHVAQGAVYVFRVAHHEDQWPFACLTHVELKHLNVATRNGKCAVFASELLFVPIIVVRPEAQLCEGIFNGHSGFAKFIDFIDESLFLLKGAQIVSGLNDCAVFGGSGGNSAFTELSFEGVIVAITDTNFLSGIFDRRAC